MKDSWIDVKDVPMPTDGTEILVYIPNVTHPRQSVICPAMFWGVPDEPWYFHDRTLDGEKITHWQPLITPNGETLK